MSFLTSKVRPVCQLHLLVELGDDARYTVLDEVHLLPNRSLPDDVIVWLKHLELQLAQHPCHKVGVCVGKQRHGGHQLTAVEVDDFLVERKKKGEFWSNTSCHELFSYFHPRLEI